VSLRVRALGASVSDGRATRASIEVRSWQEWPLVAEMWGSLAEESPHSSFFLTSTWVGSWLSVFGNLLQPKLLLFRDARGVELQGICLFVARSEASGPFRVSRAYLNTAGEDEADEACVEYNTLLCRSGCESVVAASFTAYVQEQSWDELVLKGMAANPVLSELQAADYDAKVVSHVERSAYFVPLRSFGSGDKPTYLSLLSRNTRDQIRRSIKIYESRGPVEVRAAVDLADSQLALSQLADLHQMSWTARGKKGTFGSERLMAFHRRLVDSAFPSSGVQMLRVTVGGDLLAVLYLFLFRERVYFYQSGIKYEEDNRLKPGLVAHALAIEFYRSAGFAEYDFLAGDSRYKKSLATSQRPLAWITYRRSSLKTKAIETLRFVRKRVFRGSYVTE
jgi:hypothetical protein